MLSSLLSRMSFTNGNIPAPKQEPGFPLKDGMSLSVWLQGVRDNSLLDHRGPKESEQKFESTTKELPKSADVVVIGSGLSGTLTAHTLLTGPNPPKSIVVLEAREFCSGATGRNAGHCKPDQWRGFDKYASVHGTEQAKKILDNEQETFLALVDYVRKNNVDCDLWTGDTLDVAMNDQIAADTKKIFENCKASGYNVDAIRYISNKEEASKVSRIKSAAAVWAWTAGALYPWKLTAHIMNECLERGLNLQTWTRAEKVIESETTPGSWVVVTDRGSIEAKTIVHATNAYAPAMLPEFKELIAPRPFICNHFIPPKSFSGTNKLQNTYAVLLPNNALFSINCNGGGVGHVLLGGSNPGQPEMDEWLDQHPEHATNDGLYHFESVNNAAIDFTEKEFIDWGSNQDKGPGQGFHQSWTGVIGRSADGVPWVGARPGYPGQYVIAGHNGHGMARIFTCAPALAKIIQGTPYSQTGLPECFELTKERLVRARNGKGISVGQ